MAYTLSISVVLGAANTGLSLTAALVNPDGTAAAGLTTTNLVEITAGSGTYLWTGSIPDGFRGAIEFTAGGLFKAAAALNPEEAENTDVKTSTRSTLTAADVWAASTRTLTDFGTLVSSIWSAATRTLTQAVAAVTPPPVITGDAVTLLRGDTLTLPFTGLGDLTLRTKLWFTVKTSDGDADTASILQITEAGGLLYLNGAPATSSQGSITVTDAATGALTVSVVPAATTTLALGLYHYDIQMLVGTVVTTLTSGQLRVSADITRAVS